MGGRRQEKKRKRKREKLQAELPANPPNPTMPPTPAKPEGTARRLWKFLSCTAWPRVKAIPKIVWLLVLGVGGVGALSVYVPRIPVEIGPPPETGLPFPAKFKLMNNNFYNLYGLELTECRTNKVVLDTFVDFEGDIIFFDSGQPNTKKLGPDESDYATCKVPGNLRQGFLYADIEVLVSYRWMVPFAPRTTKAARFVGRWKRDGKWVWEPRPKEAPDVGIAPDDSSLVRPPTPLPGPTREAAEKTKAQ